MAMTNDIEPKSGKTYKELFEIEKKKNEKPKKVNYKAKYETEKNKGKDNKKHIPAKSSDLDDRENDFNLKDGDEFVIFRPNHGLMAKDRLNEKDLTPQKTFFYRHLLKNKTYIWTEQEASLMMKSNQAPYFKQIGCSDGSTYKQYIKNCGIKIGEKVSRQQAEKILKEARTAEEEVAKGNLQRPQDQSVHFGKSYPVEMRSSFVPPK